MAATTVNAHNLLSLIGGGNFFVLEDHNCERNI